MQARALVVLLLAAAGLALRAAVRIDGAPDVDTVNFGLSAWRFSLVDHQPHPPGYLGYVLYLKALHALLPSMEPITLALWGSRIASALTLPAAWWSVRTLASERGADPRDADSLGLAAAGLAAMHPLLWYSGCDGQSHSAEALATFALFGFGARVASRVTTARLALLTFAVAASASLRPTVVLPMLPLLLWLLRPRPWRARLIAAGAGLVGVLGWYVPLVWLSGGPALYARINRALIVDIFVANYSVTSIVAHPRAVLGNMGVALMSLALASIPLISHGTAAWKLRRPWAMGIALATLFYMCSYTAESGYFSGVAALCCLVPATWTATPAVRRGVEAAVLGAAIFLLGPERVPLTAEGGAYPIPTVQRLRGVDSRLARFRRQVCDPLRGAPAIVLTDDTNTTLTRAVPLRCQNVAVGWYIYHPAINPRLDHWQVFYRDGMGTAPTPVPFEMGPPAMVTTRFPVEWVVVGADASTEFRDAIRSFSSCPPEPLGTAATFYRARCVPMIHLGQNTLRIRVR